MQNIIIIGAILAIAVATPAVFIEDHGYPSSSQLVDHGYVHTPVFPVVHELSSAKSTVTKSSQVVNHGGTTVIHAPIYTHVHELPSKSTVTKTDHVVNHGEIVHPVYHLPVVHELSSAKSTLTKSSQVVNHGGTAVLHAPIAISDVSTKGSQVNHGSTVHQVPVYSHLMHHSLVYSPQVFSSAKIGDSAVSHHSSTVHQTEPVVNHYPLYAFHH